MERYSIQIVPKNPKIKKLVKKLSKKIKNRTLEDSPHITLITSFKTKKIKDLIKEIKNLKLQKSSFELKGPRTRNNSFLYLYPDNPKKIGNFHKKIIELIPKYRESWIHAGFQKLSIEGKRKNNLKKYGDIYCKEFFWPHLTICGFSLTKKQLNDAKRIISGEINFKVKVDYLTIKVKKSGKWKEFKRIKLN